MSKFGPCYYYYSPSTERKQHMPSRLVRLRLLRMLSRHCLSQLEHRLPLLLLVLQSILDYLAKLENNQNDFSWCIRSMYILASLESGARSTSHKSNLRIVKAVFSEHFKWIHYDYIPSRSFLSSTILLKVCLNLFFRFFLQFRKSLAFEKYWPSLSR